MRLGCWTDFDLWTDNKAITWLREAASEQDSYVCLQHRRDRGLPLRRDAPADVTHRFWCVLDSSAADRARRTAFASQSAAGCAHRCSATAITARSRGTLGAQDGVANAAPCLLGGTGLRSCSGTVARAPGPDMPMRQGGAQRPARTPPSSTALHRCSARAERLSSSTAAHIPASRSRRLTATSPPARRRRTTRGGCA